MSGYSRIIEDIFLSKYSPGDQAVPFQRSDIQQSAEKLGVKLPKNLGDVIYSFRYRAEFPDSIRKTEPADLGWAITLQGRGRYAFVLEGGRTVSPRSGSRENSRAGRYTWDRVTLCPQ